MKAPLLCSLVASSALAALTVSPSSTRTSVLPSPPGEVWTGWEFVERQIAGDSDGYRRQASREVQSHARTLRAMQDRCEAHAIGSRTYLATRVQALREHLDYTRAELLKLPSSSGDQDFTAAHAHFHRTLRHLEAAFAQATAELSDGA